MAEKGNEAAYREIDGQFHNLIINACGNEHLIQLIRNFNKQTMRYRSAVMSGPDWMANSVKSHTAIVASFEAGDADDEWTFPTHGNEKIECVHRGDQPPGTSTFLIDYCKNFDWPAEGDFHVWAASGVDAKPTCTRTVGVGIRPAPGPRPGGASGPAALSAPGGRWSQRCRGRRRC